MAEIVLNTGRIAMVDECDLELLAAYRWLSVSAGRRTEKLYAVAWLKGENKSIYMHRLITGAAKGQYVDHRNGDSLDNRRDNLRLASARQNAGNIRVTKGSRSGYRGVQPSYPAGKWVARIGDCGVTVGRFETPEEAARAYDAAAKARFGEFAVLNFPN